MDKDALTMVVSENHIPEELTDENQGFVQNRSNLKKCPFCAELIQPEAIKCRYCGEFLDGSVRSSLQVGTKKWYYSTPAIIIAMLCLGAAVIPFVLKNPFYKTSTKIILSVVSLAYTAYCVYLIYSVYSGVFEQLNALGI